MNSSYYISENEALNRLMNLCSRSEKSEFDILQKLTEWGIEDKAGKIITILKNEKYIDNSRFARAFAVDKIRFNKWGKYKVGYLLRGKHISDLEIKDALGKVDYDEYRTIVFEELSKKKKSLKINDPYKIKNKIFAFANQRGYESELTNEFLGMK
jgi:regulatory protein